VPATNTKTTCAKGNVTAKPNAPNIKPASVIGHACGRKVTTPRRIGIVCIISAMRPVSCLDIALGKIDRETLSLP